MLSSPKKKRRVFTRNFWPLNGILVPSTAKRSTRKKVFTRNSVTLNGTGDPKRLCGLSKNNKKVFHHNSGPPNKIRGSSTAKGISCHTTLGPLWWAPKCSFMDSYTPMGPGQINPCNPQSPSYKPWMRGGPVVCLLYPWHSVGTIYSAVLEQKM